MSKFHLSSKYSSLLIVCLVLCLASCSNIKYRLFEMAKNHELGKAGLTARTIDLDGKPIALLESEPADDGNAHKPCMVLIHGFGATKENWVRFAGYLTDQYHVIAMDLPGHGESFKDFSIRYDLDDQVGYVSRILKQLHVDRFHLAGNSMGGAISALYAAYHPDQVESLLLIDPAGIYEYKCELTQLLSQGKNPLIVKKPDDFYKLMDFALEKKPFIPWPITSVLAEKAVNHQRINEKIYADIHGQHAYVYKDELKKITAPTMIFWGDSDRVIAPGNAKIFKKLIPNAQEIIFKGVGHAPMLEIPEKSSSAYKDFLSKL